MQKFLIKPAPQIIGVLLLYTGIYKLIWPADAVAAIETIGFGAKTATALIMAVTISELYLGTILTASLNLRFALLATTCLIFCFTAFLWYLSALAHPPSCGCFGLTKLFFSNRQNAVFGMLRNCAVLWLLMEAYKYQSRPVPEHGKKDTSTSIS